MVGSRPSGAAAMSGDRPGPLPPHHLFAGLLDPATLASLLDWTLERETGFEAARIAGRGYSPSMRRCASFAAGTVNPWYEVIADRVRALAPELFERVRVKPFEIAHAELELTAYNDGAFFRPHIDTMTGSGRGDSDRIVSGVYYFHREPKGFSGGALRLHPFGSTGEGGGFVDIEPVQNSLLLFPSWARHEVRPVACPSGLFADSRFAINCWLHGRR